MAEQRIVSLLPSTTEIACALGARDTLVGRSHECDYPPGVEALPACTRPKFDDGTSREIDDRVKDLVRRGLSVYDVDAELLRKLYSAKKTRRETLAQKKKTLLGNIEAALKTAGAVRHHREGVAQSGWVLLDYGDVIVHLFGEDERDFYDIEGAWSQAVEVVRLQ